MLSKDICHTRCQTLLTQLTAGRAHGPAPWGFIVPPREALPGVAVFAHVDLIVRSLPSGGAPGAFAARGSREAADGAAYYLRRSHRSATLKLSLNCPEPRRLFAIRGAALLGAIAAARSAGEEPSRDDLVAFADELGLGWTPDLPPGGMLGAWLLSASALPGARWASPDDPRLDVRAEKTVDAILAAAPDLQPIWDAASAQDAAGLSYDPLHGHVAVIFRVGSAPPAPPLPGYVMSTRVGLGYAWS